MQSEDAPVNLEVFLLTPGKLIQDPNLQSLLCANLKDLYFLMSKKKVDSGDNIFIGAHPVSMSIQNIQNIDKYEYLVCEKTDGIRYFLLILGNGKGFFHGRNLVKSKENQFQQEMQFFSANLRFPANFNEAGSDLRIKYLFDGELVLDHYKDKKIIKYLIFDTLVFEYNRVFAKDYRDRLECSRRFLSYLKMSQKLISDNKNIHIKYLPFDKNSPKITLSLKDFFRTEDCDFIFSEYFKKLPHKQDGLIFTLNKAPYRPGRNDTILKWKEASLQTIDFLIAINKKFNNPKISQGRFVNRVLDLYLFGYNKEFGTIERVLFDFMIVKEEQYNRIAAEIEKLQSNSDSVVSGLIAECKFTKENENYLLEEVFKNNTSKTSDFLWKMGMYNQGNDAKYAQVFEENLNYYINNHFRGGWEIYGFRRDKSEPNAFETGVNIMVGIRNPIDPQALIMRTRRIPGENPSKKRKL